MTPLERDAYAVARAVWERCEAGGIETEAELFELVGDALAESRSTGGQLDHAYRELRALGRALLDALLPAKTKEDNG